MPLKPHTTIVKTNIDGYGYFEGKPTQRKRHTLQVSFILDMVHGPWHQPEDLMNWICHSPYVDTVTYQEKSAPNLPEDPGLDQSIKAFNDLEYILGWVGNASDAKITIFQDDATSEYIIKVGSKTYYGPSLAAALDNAARD